MLRFEYLKTGIIEEERLKDLGEDGWELVVVDRGKYIFKRQRRNTVEEILKDSGLRRPMPNTDWYKPDRIKGR